MKKIFTLMMLAASSAAAMATDYNDQLVVVMNGMEIANKPSTISVNQNEDKTYKLSINNFVLAPGMSVGNIVVDNVKGVEADGATYLATNQTIQITPGDLEGVGPSDWTGPKLGDVPVVVKAEVRGDKLTAIIDINMALMNQVINVTFGSGYQIKNSGFEDFHKANLYDADGVTVTTSSDEPNAWHSFMSCTGEMASFVNSLPHTFISDSVRPGSNGKKSVLITSSGVQLFPGVVLPIAANGTLTTGQLQAGSADATNTLNNAFLDLTNEAVDGNGDPFYSMLNARPDSVAVWVKFKQGEADEEDPYATLSAVVTDGTYYQDPEDKEYSNIVAKAQDKEIATNGYAWQRLAIPFDYETYAANNAVAKAILVTISTNATPGGGSTTDSIFVDDFELIYNSTVTGINVKGTAVKDFDQATSKYVVGIAGDNADITADDIEVLTDAKGAKVFVDITDIDEEGVGSVANITVLSADLKSSSTYVVNTYTEGYLTGIANVEGDSNEVEAIYNLNGQRVDSPVKGQVYITKYANGKTVKTVKK